MFEGSRPAFGLLNCFKNLLKIVSKKIREKSLKKTHFFCNLFDKETGSAVGRVSPRLSASLASNKQATSKQQASKKQATGTQQASNKQATSKQQASNKQA